MRNLIPAAALLALAAAMLPATASGRHQLTVSPTAGVWRWDEDGYPDLTIDEFGPLFGLRLGYAATDAFAVEAVVLTGTVDAGLRADPAAARESLRQTLYEISLVVNFQTLAGTRFYPFLDLGVGVADRDGAPSGGEALPLDDQNFAFHLGGGLMFDFNRRWGLRLNLRDSFFTDDRVPGNAGDRRTVDSLELSAGLVARFPLGKKGPRGLQERGFDAGRKWE